MYGPHLYWNAADWDHDVCNGEVHQEIVGHTLDS